jgi:hypothetical protein
MEAQLATDATSKQDAFRELLPVFSEDLGGTSLYDNL